MEPLPNGLARGSMGTAQCRVREQMGGVGSPILIALGAARAPLRCNAATPLGSWVVLYSPTYVVLSSIAYTLPL